MEASKKNIKPTNTDYYIHVIGIIDGLKLALEILNQPSNTQMQTGGLREHCKKCSEEVKIWPKYKRDCMGKVGHR